MCIMSGVSVYLSRLLHKNWQIGQNIWVNHPPFSTFFLLKMLQFTRFSRVKLNNFGIWLVLNIWQSPFSMSASWLYPLSVGVSLLWCQGMIRDGQISKQNNIMIGCQWEQSERPQLSLGICKFVSSFNSLFRHLWMLRNLI